ncbi:sensor histidine kinase [Gandjariella thermophila]|uniref:histidine kinase n=1 Tax=Gandjariella thermophila TaxID=1931992 RepID=A0A4D4J6G0_9PSEU|nr:ATP-binding protein [Gandjariella thermophila]GDY29557.1 histidine kinase [Gandjariella thermophila]
MAQPPSSSSRAARSAPYPDDRGTPQAARSPLGGRGGLSNELLNELVDRGSRLVSALRRAWQGEYPPPRRRPVPTSLAYHRPPSRDLLPDVLASLALRDLTLVESLLKLIEQAEAREEDPEQLSFLYQIDHLATRMRRHSENLLVLAGHDSNSAQFEPVSLLDVVRAAISEATDYSRVQLGTMPNVRVVGLAADDVSHLLAELLDNAATKSPRHAPIQVSGHPGEASTVLVVEDGGIGVAADRLADLNARLDGAPVLDASVTRHMGLYVVSRLAHRHGIRVRMEARAGGGTVVYVTLPDRIIQANPPAPAARPPQAPARPRTVTIAQDNTLPPLPPRQTPPRTSTPDGQPATTPGGLPRRIPRSTMPYRGAAAGTPPPTSAPAGTPLESGRSAAPEPADGKPVAPTGSAAQRIHDELDAFQAGQSAALRDAAAGRPDDSHAHAAEQRGAGSRDEGGGSEQ